MDSLYYRSETFAERLKKYGLIGWPPTVESLAELVIDTSDRLDVICDALDIDTVKDHRGKWSIHPKGDDRPW